MTDPSDRAPAPIRPRRRRAPALHPPRHPRPAPMPPAASASGAAVPPPPPVAPGFAVPAAPVSSLGRVRRRAASRRRRWLWVVVTRLALVIFAGGVAMEPERHRSAGPAIDAESADPGRRRDRRHRADRGGVERDPRQLRRRQEPRRPGARLRRDPGHDRGGRRRGPHEVPDRRGGAGGRPVAVRHVRRHRRPGQRPSTRTADRRSSARSFPNTPAEEAGLQRGDQIVAVDGETTEGETVDEIVSRVRGPGGRAGHADDRPRRRGRLRRHDHPPRVRPAARELGDGPGPRQVAMIRLDQFATGATEGARGRDQRRQGGRRDGDRARPPRQPRRLRRARRSASPASSCGDGIVYQAIDRDGDGEGRAGHSRAGLATGIPLVVLADGGTASSAEIVTGAIQDADARQGRGREDVRHRDGARAGSTSRTARRCGSASSAGSPATAGRSGTRASSPTSRSSLPEDATPMLPGRPPGHDRRPSSPRRPTRRSSRRSRSSRPGADPGPGIETTAGGAGGRLRCVGGSGASWPRLAATWRLQSEVRPSGDSELPTQPHTQVTCCAVWRYSAMTCLRASGCGGGPPRREARCRGAGARSCVPRPGSGAALREAGAAVDGLAGRRPERDLGLLPAGRAGGREHLARAARGAVAAAAVTRRRWRTRRRCSCRRRRSCRPPGSRNNHRHRRCAGPCGRRGSCRSGGAR